MRRALVLLLVTASWWPAQDLPREVLLLARIRARVRESLDRLPDCTCLENVSRFHQLPGKALRPVDTAVFQILFSGDKELFSAPGDTHWDTNLFAFLSAGMMGNGLFALHLRSIFLNNQSVIVYHGMEDLGGRQEARYDFTISKMLSGYKVNTARVSGVVAIRGSFWADPESYDLRRVEFHAEEIPPDLLMTGIYTGIYYERVQIGAADVLLPQAADLRTTSLDGSESRNSIEFTHCQAFHTETTLHFGEVDPGTPAPASVQPPDAVRTEQNLAPDLRVTIALTAPLDNRLPVGSLIEGRVAANVTHKSKLLIPEGAVVKGRIRRLERHTDLGDYFVVALEFTRIDAPAASFRFYADLLDVDRREGAEMVMATTALKGSQLIRGRASTFELPGVGTFFVRGSHFSLAAGFKTVWKTQLYPQSATR